MWGRIHGWVRRNMPTRDSMEANRWLRPVSHRVLAPELWRFTRRSVPRGVALGMVTGIMIPVGQIALAAVLALPFRANVPTAALTTFLTNPVTTPPLWAFAYWVGRKILQLDATVPGQPITTHVANDSWLNWLWSEAGPALITGLVTITIVSAILGYLMSAVGWRMWIARKWRKRVQARRKVSIET
ncbi:DUF2062 domain-containing protein [Sphingomonas sp. ST-64]|uniref:DUF2062 domain-containing protein n=1 Tax=Sphingomonas plantiphila TaxID=3163295 RepID=A0ABW8YPD1_9SPHN